MNRLSSRRFTLNAKDLFSLNNNNNNNKLRKLIATIYELHQFILTQIGQRMKKETIEINGAMSKRIFGE